MKDLILFTFFLILQNVALATNNVTVYLETSATTFQAWSYNSGSSTSVVTALSTSASDGTSTAESPHNMYVPMYITGEYQKEYSIADNPNAIIEDDSSDTANGFIRIRLRAKPDSDAILYQPKGVYFKANNKWAPFDLNNSEAKAQMTLPATTDVAFDTYFYLRTMCADDGNVCLPSTTQKTFKLYFFLVPVGTGLSSEYDSVPVADGTYVNLNLSKQYYEDTSYAPTITQDIIRGDGQLKIVFTTSSTISNPYGVVAYNGTASSTGVYHRSDLVTIDHYQKLYFDDNFISSGTFTVANLINDTTYHLAIALTDKYQFATRFSLSREGTPKSIETILKEQSCYLLTAGFKEEHYVIDYFKMLRDHYLMKFSLGQSFVSFYYATAPAFAITIYKSEFLSWLIRVSAYSLYYFLNWHLYIIALIFFPLKWLTQKLRK